VVGALAASSFDVDRCRWRRSLGRELSLLRRPSRVDRAEGFRSDAGADARSRVRPLRNGHRDCRVRHYESDVGRRHGSGPRTFDRFM